MDGKNYGPVELIEKLNQLGAANGVGIDDIVENRLVGMKSRGVYETPGGTILYYAHRELEYLTLDRQTFHLRRLRQPNTQNWSMMGSGIPLRQAIDAFVDVTQEMLPVPFRLKFLQGKLYPRRGQIPLFPV